MSNTNTNLWESHDANPMLWMATTAIALVAHLAALQVGITAYQSHAAKTAEPPQETKIFAAALQLAGAEVTPPPQLVDTPAPVDAAPVVEPPEPAPQVLTPAVAAPVVADLVSSAAPIAAQAPTLAPVATPSAPQTSPPPQPGVAPVAAAPLRAATLAKAVTVDNDETLDVAVLDAPSVIGTEPAPIPVPDPAPVPNPAPLPDLAKSLPPPPSDITEDQSGVASANAPAQSAEQAQETYDTVLDFLRGFDGGPCFAALPVLAEDGAFRFETFAQSDADLARFRQALELETGTLPGTVMKPVSDAQCQALPFVTAAARYPEFQLYFDIAARDIPSGDLLSGKLGNTSGGFVSLLLIDDEGVVQDLGSFLKFRAGYAGFDIPMTLKGSPVKTQQLLMALSTRARLKTLKSLSGQPAKDFFKRLSVEILLQGGGEDVALVAFSVR
ncbi:hypothetical protein [Litoreibacter albidus]|uniref:hypothetical protein n=1 Tax=Litoreibacter albidus TaxID=670155 RepID=UPI003734DB66